MDFILGEMGSHRDLKQEIWHGMINVFKRLV